VLACFGDLVVAFFYSNLDFISTERVVLDEHHFISSSRPISASINSQIGIAQ